jgi:hypothetical protein
MRGFPRKVLGNDMRRDCFRIKLFAMTGKERSLIKLVLRNYVKKGLNTNGSLLIIKRKKRREPSCIYKA